MVRLLFNLSQFLNSNLGMHSAILYYISGECNCLHIALKLMRTIFIKVLWETDRDREERQANQVIGADQRSVKTMAMFGNYYEYHNQLLSGSNPVLSYLLLELRAVTILTATASSYLTINGACLQTDHPGTDELEIVLLSIPCQMWSDKWGQSCYFYLFIVALVISQLYQHCSQPTGLAIKHLGLLYIFFFLLF